jgi:hypothetical protein
MSLCGRPDCIHLVRRDDGGVASRGDSSLTQAVVQATKGLAEWAQGKLKPSAVALHIDPTSDELEPT